MASNQKFKSVILSINLDFLLKNKDQGQERCARNIIELGFSLSPKDNLRLQKDLLYQNLLTILRDKNVVNIKSTVFEWFTKTFF